MALSNADIARVFSRLAVMLELDGANVFRVRAHREAARMLSDLAEPLGSLAAREGALEELPGIGKDLAQKIRDLLSSGTTPAYEELKAKYPLDLVELTELQGLGPKRVKQLFDTLGIADRASLEKAARGGQLRDLPGFGEKLETKILASLAIASQVSGRMLLAGAWPVAHELAARLGKVAGVEQVEIAGSFRRRRETIGDLDLLVTGGRAEAVMDAFTKHDQVIEVLGRGDTKSSVRLASGLQVDLRHVPSESFGAALLYFTGSKQHNIELRKMAIEKGWSLNEYGLTHGKKLIAGRTETDVYRALDLPYIPPELREAAGEFELARAGKLPRLIEEGDLRGDLHMHSNRSDGRDTVEAMIRGAKARGYAYCAITEHSKSLAMAGGFDAARVRKSVKEIEAARRAVPGIEVLHGLEVDILADGALDLDDDSLALLDWVIVSLHSRLDQPRAEVTARVLRALDHPLVKAMAHPTGRLIGSRPGADLDFERIFERAAQRGVLMEINAQPDRTDLNDAHARFAHQLGVRIVIDTDAHSVTQLENIRYGVFAARRAGLTREAVLNTRPYAEFHRGLRQPRHDGKAAPPVPAAASRREAGVSSSRTARPAAGAASRSRTGKAAANRGARAGKTAARGTAPPKRRSGR
jgi:DNA polymerase (family 10)